MASHEDTRARIVAAAATHFARFGFDAASLRRIADDAGIKAASIFHHFPGGKRELFAAIMRDIADTIRERIVARWGADIGLDAEDAIVHMAAAFWDYFADHPDYATILLHQASGLHRELAGTIEGYIAGVVDVARAFIVRAQARGALSDFDVPHFMLWVTAQTLAIHGAPYLSAYVEPKGAHAGLRSRHLAMVRAHIHIPATSALRATPRERGNRTRRSPR